MPVTRESILKDFEDAKKEGFTWEQYYDSLSNTEKKIVSDIIYKAPTIGQDIFIAPTQGGLVQKESDMKYDESLTHNNKSDKSFKMPTWGWVAIGVGSLAVLALVITLGIKASRKAKAA
jgi:hypothetical protein